jgi:glyoxylase-like metal-dependent hydrolase (beta-lactamase superfamily II)
MQIGSFTVEILSEGRFEFFRDGHINRVANEIDSEERPSDGTSAVVGINPILVKTGPYNILLDSGLGWGLDAGSEYKNVSNIRTNLEIFGLEPEDITHVILSHLHYDHMAGCSFTDSELKTRPTFPEASYYVHKREWDYALSQVQNESKITGIGYQLDDFYRLIADQRVTLLTGTSNKIVEGITAICTGGHTPGHLVTIINANRERGYYLGDLLPSSSHLNHYAMGKIDFDPVQAKKHKIQLLRSAFEEEACLFFYHSQHSQAGSLAKDKNKQYVLNEL